MPRFWFLLISLAMVFASAPLSAQQPGFAWLEQATGITQSFLLKELCPDYSGNIFVAGTYTGTIILGDQSYSSESSQEILYKLDANGDPVWVMPMDYQYFRIYDIGADVAGNSYILATYLGALTAWGVELPYQGNSNFFVAKFSPAGEMIWVKQAGGVDCNPQMAVTRTGECYIGGEFRGTAYLSGETFVASYWGDLFVTKLDTSGNIVWAQHNPCERGVELIDMTTDSIGNCYLTGLATWGITFEDIFLDQSTYTSVAFYAKYNYLGDCTMAKQLASNTMDESAYRPKSIVPDELGGLYIYYYMSWDYYSNGSLHEVNQVRVSKTTAAGAVSLMFNTPGGQWISPGQMFLNTSGTLVLTGIYRGAATFGAYGLSKPQGFYIARLSTTQPYPVISALDPVQGNFDTYSYRSCFSPANELLLSFYSPEPITIGSYTSLEVGRNLVKINPSGVPQWGKSTWLDYKDISGLGLIQHDQALFTCGSFSGDTTMANDVLKNHGATDLYVAGLSQSGEWLWAASGGGEGYDLARAIAADDSSCLYVTGYYSGMAEFGGQNLVSNGGRDIFVAKIDPFGNWGWTVSAGGPGDDEGSDLKFDAMGNLILTGTFSELAGFGSLSAQSAGATDIFVARLDLEGNWLGLISGGGTGIDHSNALDITYDGSILIGGAVSQIASFGNLQAESAGAMDALIAKLGSDLSWLWLKVAGGAEDDQCVDLGLDQSGASYITGSFLGRAFFGSQSLVSQGNTDIFLAKLDQAGAWVWAQSAGGAYADSVRCLVLDSQGNSVIAGTHTGSMSFDNLTLEGLGSYDVFLSKQDSNGDYMWLKRAGGEAYESANALASDPEGALYICGITSGDFYTGTSWLDPNGDTDTFIGCLMDGLEIGGEAVPTPEYSSLVIYPNPFSQNLFIKFDNPSRGEVAVRIFNLRGQLLRTLMDSTAPKGELSLIWDGTDKQARSCTNAVYLLQVQASGRSFTRRILLQRN